MSLKVLSIQEQGFTLLPGQKVIRASDYAVVEKSTHLVEMARKQAAEIVSRAEQAYNDEKQRGYQDGLMQSRMEQSEQMLKMVDRSIKYLADVEVSLADILMTAVRKIIEGFDDRALTVGLIKSGLQHVRNERQVSVRVPPAHFSYVKEQLAEILSGYKGIGILNPVSDPRLKSGSCIIESKIGVVDASVEVQLQALRNRFGQLSAHSMESVDEDQNNNNKEWAENIETGEEDSLAPAEPEQSAPEQPSGEKKDDTTWFT